jgi:hypothetical protein
LNSSSTTLAAAIGGKKETEAPSPDLHGVRLGRGRTGRGEREVRQRGGVAGKERRGSGVVAGEGRTGGGGAQEGACQRGTGVAVGKGRGGWGGDRVRERARELLNPRCTAP